ncbi:Calcium-dependent protein kinase 28 [Zea mays]|uniref:Calcium-dependent protein kinase 28 n=1 Tax=Zea mays TaxID=4577 RepID=A0A1D6EKT6_MAIZE|nr:Calcium-dependent protein kinase 28 [Zea mays]
MGLCSSSTAARAASDPGAAAAGDAAAAKKGRGIVACGKRTDFGYDKDFEVRYSLGKLLGHGQFGYTFAAVDRASTERVAVKRIDKNKMVLPVAVEDVKREVKILKALQGHENVVHFYNAFEDDNYVYIVMELCEGGELLDRILAKKDSRYSEKDAAVVVRQMLKVAAECHLHGLVHRDMKPENFLFKSKKEDSPLKATDFGLSDFIKPGLVLCFSSAHDWVREGGKASEIPLDISVLHNMRQFVKYSRFKQFALRALASTLNSEEMSDLRDQFNAIDVDKNGTISLEELKQVNYGWISLALAKDVPWRLKGPRVLEIIEAIDSNTDGLVDFEEFVAATLHVHQLVEHDTEKWKSLSQAAFDKFDVDRDGYITPDELRMHTGMKGSIDPLLEEADIDKDGKISLDEFRRLLKTASMSARNVQTPRGVRKS